MRNVARVTSNARTVLLALTLAMLTAISSPRSGYGEQPPPPCHPNPNAALDSAAVASRGDIVTLPQPLQDRLIRLADCPHTYLPIQAFAEADGPSQLFQYYLLDTAGFEPSVFTTIFPGVNEDVQLTVTGATAGSPRSAPYAWCWSPSLIHDVTVPPVAPPRHDGHAQFGTITACDAEILKRMGTGNNVPGHIFTADGRAPHFPSASDHFPDSQTNVARGNERGHPREGGSPA